MLSYLHQAYYISRTGRFWEHFLQTSLRWWFQVKLYEILKDQIVDCLAVNPAYGHRRIALELRVGKKRVRRVMRLFHIKPYKRKARWTKKRDYGKPDAGFPNLIKGSCPIKPGVIFVGDFTRLSWNGKIIYLATFMDLYTREIVGWNISTRHDFELIADAFSWIQLKM